MNKLGPFRENTIIVGDCLDIMRQMPDGCVDLVVTDPPYQTTDLDFDKDELDMAWIKQLLRVVKPNGYLATFCPVEMYQSLADVWHKRFTGIWLKEKGGMRTHSAKKPMNQFEMFVVFAHPKHQIAELTWNEVFIEGEPYRKVQRNLGYKRGGKDQLDRANVSSWTQDGYVSANRGTRQITDVLRGNSKGCMPHGERTPHPTQKPLNVMGIIIEWLSNEGELVIDPFVGSGTTVVAADRLKRRFFGIDIDPHWVEVSLNRLAEDRLKRSQMEMGL